MKLFVGKLLEAVKTDDPQERGRTRLSPRESGTFFGTVMTKRQEIFFRQIITACDTITLLLSFVVAYWLRDHLFGAWYGSLLPFAEYIWLLWLIVPTWVFLLRRYGLFDSTSYRSLFSLFRPFVQVQVLGGLILVSVVYLSRSWDISRLFLQIFIAVSGLGLVGEKAVVFFVLSRLRRKPSLYRRNVLVIGTSARAEQYRRLCETYPHWGTHIIGVLPTDSGAENGNGQLYGKTVLGRPANISRILQNHVVDEVVVVSPWEEEATMENVVATCVERGITFRALVEMPSTHISRYHVEELGKGGYLLSLEMVPQQPVLLLIKRLLDMAGAVIGLLLCGTVYLWYRPKIRHESPGPVFFRQTRVGHNGRLFTLFKFRTMYPDAEERLKDLLAHNQAHGHIFKMKDDPRIIPTGHILRRRHLDEMPQFWNVLRGEMSLVGTRPPTPNETEQYRSYHHRRLSMKPGITGLWQLNGHAAVSDFDDVVRLDCEYIDNWSLWLDCQVLAKTLVKVARGGGW